jgi:hypothetical protein
VAVAVVMVVVMMRVMMTTGKEMTVMIIIYQ